MSRILERVPILLEESNEFLPAIEKAAKDSRLDTKGVKTAALAGAYRRSALLHFLADNDAVTFSEDLSKSAQLRFSLFGRFDSGEPISKSLVSMLSYKYLVDALASGNMDLAVRFAGALGGREEPGEKYAHPLDKALGYALKSVIVDDHNATERIAAYRGIASEESSVDYLGYALMLDAIHHRDKSKFASSMPTMIEGHEDRCKGKGVYRDTLDELLSVSCIGLTNLAAHKGLVVEVDHPLIPKILLSL